MRFIIRVNESNSLDEKTYTIGDTQYWKRSGKFYSWTESGGRIEISEDEYTRALNDTPTETTKSKSEVQKSKVIDEPSTPTKVEPTKSKEDNKRLLSTDEEVKKFRGSPEEYLRKFGNELTSEDMVRDVASWVYGAAYDINKSLRDDEPMSEDDKQIFDNMETLIHSMPKWGDKTLYRGLRVDKDTAEKWLSLEKGENLDLPGITSWTSKSDDAKFYSNITNHGAYSGDTPIFIKSRKGAGDSDAISLDKLYHKKRDEIVFSSHTDFEIEWSGKTQNGIEIWVTPRRKPSDTRKTSTNNIPKKYKELKLDKSVGKGYNGVVDSRTMLYDKGLFGDLLDKEYQRTLDRYKEDLEKKPDKYKEWYGDVTPEDAAKQAILDTYVFNATEVYKLAESNPDTLLGALYKYQYYGANPNGKGYGQSPNARKQLDEEYGISKFIEDNEDIQYNSGDELYRGMRMNNKQLNDMIKATESKELFDNNGVSSWSSDVFVARQFARDAWKKGRKDNRIVLVNRNEGRRLATSFCGFSNTESAKEVMYSGNQLMVLDEYKPEEFNGNMIHYFYVKDVIENE